MGELSSSRKAFSHEASKGNKIDQISGSPDTLTSMHIRGSEPIRESLRVVIPPEQRSKCTAKRSTRLEQCQLSRY